MNSTESGCPSHENMQYMENLTADVIEASRLGVGENRRLSLTFGSRGY